MSEQLSLLSPVIEPISGDVALTPGEVRLKLMGAREGLKNESIGNQLDQDCDPIAGWGPDEYESLGPNWAEKDGEVLPPSNGQTFDTDPGAYEEYLTEVISRAAAEVVIAACRATLWQNYSEKRG